MDNQQRMQAFTGRAVRRRALGAAVAAALTAAVLTTGPASAGVEAEVALGASFGERGKVVTDFAGWYDRGNAVAAIGDGVIVAGDANAPGTSLRTGDFGLARYDKHGRLDRAFGSHGKVTTDFLGDLDTATTVAVQSDGKVVVAGQASTANQSRTMFALARYRANGSLDTSFGTGGKIITDLGGDAAATAMVIQRDGKLVVGGIHYPADSSTRGFELVRYLPDGTLDSSFGTGGRVVTLFEGRDDLADLALQPDGRIIAVGVAGNYVAPDIAVARYRTDGSLDPGFGTGGKVTTDLGSLFDTARAVAVRPDGTIAVAGELQEASGSDFLLANYRADGSLNPDFGTDGTVITDISGGNDQAYAVLAYGEDLIVAGTATVGSHDNFALVRYHPDGALDTGFGSNGKLTTDFGYHAVARGLAKLPHGRLVAAGSVDYRDQGGTGDFAVAGYHLD
ncbi:hypothetical protein Q0Z83_026090 [Actinoplanes sichuanensis]|uniref:Delta-60 repeat domain-containing protein n=1 Tax=Actinoplanes sichuanensis TaxID=512349 RepID=A0ABW4AY16_9ACTN|nr:hypothetical protein [Actinoplanes sichuanensis]BEL04418.1 hypothetical protein Q0Z83_026090 [Actinoplanes sichuanensis]